MTYFKEAPVSFFRPNFDNTIYVRLHRINEKK
jgi:hypothetical protein